MTHSTLRSRCTRLLGGAALVAGLAVGGAGAATADGSDVERTELSGTAQTEAHGYWTSERMEAAIPADDLAPEDAPSHDAVEKGEPTTVQGRSAEAPGMNKKAAAGEKDTVGRVFFTQGGQDYVCSGNSVASSNGSTVSTAGHCVNDAGTWATNWVFVPGYDHGDAPYGTWAATDLVSTDEWVSSEDISYDVAFATVEPESGSGTLEDAVGSTSIAFNRERGADYDAYGYPAAAPFDGDSLESCSGSASDDTIGGTLSQGISCDMTGGSSGGPWFLGDGAQNSVNSFGYNGQANVMYGPYFGSEAQSAYQEAAA